MLDWMWADSSNDDPLPLVFGQQQWNGRRKNGKGWGAHNTHCLREQKVWEKETLSPRPSERAFGQ